MKNYKKMSLRAMMLALATVLLAGFASCSSKSDDNDSSSKEDTTAVAGVMDITFNPSEDMLALFDITVEYTDKNGKVTPVTVTGEWKTKVTYTTLPAKASFTIKWTAKSGVQYTKDSYVIGYVLTPAVYAANAAGTKVGADLIGMQVTNKETVKKENMDWYMGKSGSGEKCYSYTINNKPDAYNLYVH